MLPNYPELVLLRATVLDALDLVDWIGRIKQCELYVICTKERPVLLGYHLYFNQEIYLVPDSTKQFQTASYLRAYVTRKNAPMMTKMRNGEGLYHQGIIQHLHREHWLPVICFTFSRHHYDSNAKFLNQLDLTTSEDKWAVQCFLNKNGFTRLELCDQDPPQLCFKKRLLNTGFGVHPRDVWPILKESIEILIQEGLVKVLFATEIFSVGVNMPVHIVVFGILRKHDGECKKALLPAEKMRMADSFTPL